MEQEIFCGIFWVLAESQSDILPENIFCIKKPCDVDGNTCGEALNHKRSWNSLPKKITRGKPFDYYPRGRVEVKKGKATVWLNGNIICLSNAIIELFGLSLLPQIVVREDGTNHYKCHFDKKVSYGCF